MTYDYVCTSCGHEWEAEQRISEAALTDCPVCEKPSAKRQISGGGGFILKGGGWYADGYASKGGDSAKTSDKPEKSDKSDKAATSDKKDGAKTEPKSDSTATSTTGDSKSSSDGSNTPSGPKGKAAAA